MAELWATTDARKRASSTSEALSMSPFGRLEEPRAFLGFRGKGLGVRVWEELTQNSVMGPPRNRTTPSEAPTSESCEIAACQSACLSQALIADPKVTTEGRRPTTIKLRRCGVLTGSEDSVFMARLSVGWSDLAIAAYGISFGALDP